MGCKNSTDKGEEKGSGATEPPDEVKELKAALLEYHGFLVATCPDHEEVLLKAYLNGCVEVLKIHFHKKADKSVELVKQVADELGQPFANAGKVVDEDYCADDGMLRCLIIWLQYKRSLVAGNPNPDGSINNLNATTNNNNNTKSQSHDRSMTPGLGNINSLDGSFAWDEVDTTFISQATAREELCLPSTANFNTYRELLDLFHATSQHVELHDVFNSLAGGEKLLSVDAFARYLKTQGYEKEVQSLARDKIRTCFGGYLTKYNFSTYYSTPRTNSVFDPQRATVVWQDMTQPLTSYFIRTQTVHSMQSVQRAINLGAKCLLFTVVQKDDGKVYCVRPLPNPHNNEDRDMATPMLESIEENEFDDQLADVLCWLKAHAFKGPTHSYPVILGFPDLDAKLQDCVAEVCGSCLEETLEKGLMFEGASIQDPQFTPAALSNKFLILADQASLVPFVGFLVADMTRDGLGVKVTDVKEGTPAAKATITKDDWLTHVDGSPIANRKQLKAFLGTATLGQEIDLRKESQETAKIVVGGSFPGVASDLDKAVFLRMVGERTGSSPSGRGPDELAPWECQVLPEDGGKLCDHHFGLIPQASNEEKMIVTNERQGVQMIESSTVAARLWADGIFSENARCGYVLKRRSKPGSHTLRFTILTRFQKDKNLIVESLATNVFGGPDFQGKDGSITVTTEDVSLLVLRFTTRSSEEGGIPGSDGPVSPKSPGKRDKYNNKESIRSVPSSLGDLVPMATAPVVYSASVPVHMLRKGYHAIPLRTPEGKTDSVVCLFEREESASSNNQ